jgi:hypothetical protein
MNIKRSIFAALTGITITAGVTACSTRPPVDQVWLYYMDGSVDKKEFKECIDPNTKGPWQANNDTYALPTSLRTWNVAPNGGDTNSPTVVGSKPGVDGQAGPQMDVWTTVEFYLNTTCSDASSPAVKFWEATGRRYNLSDGNANFNEKAWQNVLLNTLVPVQNKALQRVARGYAGDEMDTNLLYVDPKTPVDPAKPIDRDVWKAMETAMQQEFTDQLKLKVGGDYFCGIGYDRKTSTCPAVRVSITDINYHDPALQAKRAEVRAAAEDAKKRLIEAQAKVDESNKLAQVTKNPDYMRLKELETQLAIAQACAQAPNCTMVVPNGTGVNVTTK